MSEDKTYQVTMEEHDFIYPRYEFVAQANVSDPDIFERMSLDKFPYYYKEFADMLEWDQYWHTMLDTSDAPCWKWFVGGRLNASYNCVDRHLKEHKNKTAIHYVPEPEGEAIEHITYQNLYMRVNEVAAVLRDEMGLKKGDRVTLHLPMTPELPITMLACARLGIIHSQVFGGFSGKAAGERAWDSESEILITMDAYYRSGKLLDHFEKAEEACKRSEEEGQKIKTVLVWQRYKGKHSSPTPLKEGRDLVMNDLIEKHKRVKVDPVSMPAEDILFLMYTSGTTGRPKGIQHSTGGYLAYVTAMTHIIQDVKPTDVYWCMADIGWITGHSFIVYGPLSLGASTVVYEGTPTYPDPGRCWRIAEELDVNIYHTSPTAIRMLRKAGYDEPDNYNHKFKLMCTVGEPIEPEVWKWYYEKVGKNQAAIVDTYWQTENGGFLCSSVPGIEPMKPGSAGKTVPGLHAVVYDDTGREMEPGEGKAGNICMRNPWPGSMQTIWKDRDRYVRTYYERYCKDPKSKDWRDWPYMTGDAAVLASDGYFRILGRIDDIINVAGHRLGTKEVESAALVVEEVAEAAVVAAKDEIKGAVPDLYVSLKPGFEPSTELEKKIHATIRDVVGPIASPKGVWIVPDMPKTRSGKIMRRVLACVSNDTDTGDVTTLANPEVVELIEEMVKKGK